MELTDNFRSRAEILSAVETVTHGAPGIENRALVAGPQVRRLAPESRVEVIAAPAARQWRRSGWRVAFWSSTRSRDVPGRRGAGAQHRGASPHSPTAFDAAGIPYVVNRGRGFYDTREVNDLTHLLRVIANPRDEISLAAVLRSPLVGASDEALLRLQDERRQPRARR